MLEPDEHEPDGVCREHQGNRDGGDNARNAVCDSERRDPDEDVERGDREDNVQHERGIESDFEPRSGSEDEGPGDARRRRRELSGLYPVVSVADVLGEREVNVRIVERVGERAVVQHHQCGEFGADERDEKDEGDAKRRTHAACLPFWTQSTRSGAVVAPSPRVRIHGCVALAAVFYC